MSDPNDLAAFLTEGWQHISRGVADRHAPARHPTFATVSPQGKPEARTVVLRKAQRSEDVLEVQTDTRTPKIAALRANPFATLHVWVPRSDLQLRLNGAVEILTGEAVAEDWKKVPEASRVSYGTMPAPGTPIASVYAYEKPPNADRFAVLRVHLTDIDLVHLGAQHRRAFFARDDGWQGTWVAP
ncbi:MAG: pyridoxamine 5'-phosphate oxidase family protein [Pseudomonadota bacterium]